MACLDPLLRDACRASLAVTVSEVRVWNENVSWSLMTRSLLTIRSAHTESPLDTARRSPLTFEVTADLTLVCYHL